jgi:hypothetical protein
MFYRHKQLQLLLSHEGSEVHLQAYQGYDFLKYLGVTQLRAICTVDEPNSCGWRDE